MLRLDRLEALSVVLESRLVPIFYNSNESISQNIVLSCVRGGVCAVEFTNRGEHALEIFRRLAAWVKGNLPGIALGVGTVLDAPTAAMYVSYGADFVVSPALIDDVAYLCHRQGTLYIPGCGTVTEICNAEKMGAALVKVFPANSLGGPGFVKSVLGPCPWVKLMPTGGIEPIREEVISWFNAGASCIGMGSALIRKEWVAANDWGEISKTVRQVLGWIEQANQESGSTERLSKRRNNV